ncbi:MAG: GTP-binding protein [Nitrososphaeria archaeon]
MRRAVILGAAGRDFHNFNVYFRNRDDVEVVAFTATQIPFIESRRYPASLAGARYPQGIPIYPESMLPELIEKYGVTDVYFSYSDVEFDTVMRLASISIAKGASFHLLGPFDTMLDSKRPVIAVAGGRTGVGKSTISRFVYRALTGSGYRVAVVRHPMPYGDLERQAVQIFRSLDDLKDVTIEEAEEYEPHIRNGATVYAGVDYGRILELAERDADLILWDGGNNDFPFYRPDFMITVVDPTRENSVSGSYPGEACVRMADAVVINKANLVDERRLDSFKRRVREVNQRAEIFITDSVPVLEGGVDIKGKKVLAVEDGPTITHGGLSEGVAARVALEHGAELIDPRPYAVGSIADVYRKYPHMGKVLPALGYSRFQLKELEETINLTPADAVVLGTPANLTLFIKIERPVVFVRYEAREREGKLEEAVLRAAEDAIERKGKGF